MRHPVERHYRVIAPGPQRGGHPVHPRRPGVPTSPPRLDPAVGHHPDEVRPHRRHVVCRIDLAGTLSGIRGREDVRTPRIRRQVERYRDRVMTHPAGGERRADRQVIGAEGVIRRAVEGDLQGGRVAAPHVVVDGQAPRVGGGDGGEGDFSGRGGQPTRSRPSMPGLIASRRTRPAARRFSAIGRSRSGDPTRSTRGYSSPGYRVTASPPGPMPSPWGIRSDVSDFTPSMGNGPARVPPIAKNPP